MNAEVPVMIFFWFCLFRLVGLGLLFLFLCFSCEFILFGCFFICWGVFAIGAFPVVFCTGAQLEP